MSSSIRVIVRVRPQLPREEGSCLVEMPAETPGKTIHNHPKGTKEYTFDEAVWSNNPADPHYTDNRAFYRKCGSNLLDYLYQGFNVCLLAYGQTGSGKTFTMMGSGADAGIIPLVVTDILRQKENLVEARINCDVSFSYVEIYNEKVRDLLENSKVCRVREDSVAGPFVENVKTHQMSSLASFLEALHKGNLLRASATTKMNDSSSRSHAVLTITLRQTRFAEDDSLGLSVGEPVEEMISNIKLVDLAGSERLAKTQVYNQADRMKEGAQINKSLTVLGRCISILSLKPKAVVPFRDSVLTFLLKENLGGNSKTSMIFCVSPTDHDETQQTLNYATQAKQIKTVAKANSSTMITPPVDWQSLQKQDESMIDALKDQVESLKKQLEESEAERASAKVDYMIKYLQRERERELFELKYVKSQVHIRNEEIAELKGQNTYLNSELKAILRSQFRREKSSLLRSVQDLTGTCEREVHAMQNLLEDLRLKPV